MFKYIMREIFQSSKRKVAAGPMFTRRPGSPSAVRGTWMALEGLYALKSIPGLYFPRLSSWL